MATKRCYECGEDKDLEDFHINRTRPDGRSNLCKPCKSTYNALYQQEHGTRYAVGRAAGRRRMTEIARQKVLEYLSEHACADCGEADVLVLEFDHRGDKIMDVSRMVQAGFSWRTIHAEIAKCDVVCANDHRRRTLRVMGSYRLPATA